MHSKTAQAESFMKPFCVLPLNKYVNYWAQQLPQNMPLLWMSSWICAAFPKKRPHHLQKNSTQTHGSICGARSQTTASSAIWTQEISATASLCGQAVSVQILVVMSDLKSRPQWGTQNVVKRWVVGPSSHFFFKLLKLNVFNIWIKVMWPNYVKSIKISTSKSWNIHLSYKMDSQPKEHDCWNR